MVSTSISLFRTMGLTFCFCIVNQLHAQYEVTIQNQNDGQWTLKKNEDSNQVDSVKAGSEEIKMKIISDDGRIAWDIKEKQTVILKMAPKYRVPAFGKLYLGDSNDNFRGFELKMEKKNGVMTSTYKEIGYSCSPKSPMIECKSSGDNNDDGVIELKVIDSKPVIIIKALSYPGCTHDWYMNPPFGGLTLIGIRS